MSHRQRLILLASVLSATAALSFSLRAQVAAMEDELDAPAVDTGVYVRDSAIVNERITLADRMERSKEWGKAADILQEVIDKSGQRIVPTTADAAVTADPAIKQYIGAADLVQRRLAKWPADGLTAYNARYAHVAQGMLDASPFDPAVLGRVENDYFITDAGKTAALRRIDMALEAGEFGSAAWTVDRLLTLHPHLEDDRPAALFRAGLAHHLAGNDVAATKALDELKAKFATATATVAGEQTVLADALAKAFTEPAPTATAVASDSWPMLGGGPSRGRVPHTVGRPGARLFGIALPPPNLRNVARENRVEMQRRPEGDLPGVMPVVDKGELFFQDGLRIYGVSLDSGVPLSGWATTHAASNGRFILRPAVASTPRGRQMNTTVTDDRVLAVMGQVDRRLAAFTGETSETRLVCLDRRTGAQKWIGTTATLNDDAMKNISLSGSPLVVGDRVYVTGRTAKQQNFEDCYVLCFNLADGKAKWACYVSGASIFAPNWGGDGVPGNDNEAHVAHVGGRLFVSTNLGAVAAIDAYNGGLLWLTTYPRGGGDAGAMGMPQFNPQMRLRFNRGGGAGGGGASSFSAPPWAYNPPIVRDGRIFTMATDSRDVLVFNAGTGAIERRILSRDIENLDTLVGITNEGHLILAGNVDFAGSDTAMVLGIDWQKYDPATFKRGAAAEPAITLRKPLVSSGQRRDGQSIDALRGRPLLTDQFVYVPTGARLYCINLKTRQLDDKGTYPSYPRTWDPADESGEGPGNVLIAGDHVVLAGMNRVDVYTDLAIARAKLDARELAAPTDPEPRLVYAEVMFVAGDVPTSLTKLDEATQLLGGASSLRAGPQRDRLFNDALAFATKLTGSRTESPQITTQASAMFDRAAMSASTAEQQVAWRLARAKLFARTRDFNNGVRMYQEILLDEAMRVVPSFDVKDGPTSAGAVAENAITAIVTNVGPQAYTAYELVAEEKFNAAKSTADATAMLSVARSYPNARVATRALATAAETFEAKGDHRVAGHVLRQALRKNPTAGERTAIVEAMARNYLLIPGGMDLAIGRLAKAVRPDEDPKLSRPLKLADGTQLAGGSFMAVLDELRRMPPQATGSEALPDLRLAGKEVEVDPVTGRRRFKKAFLPRQPQDEVTGIDAMVIPKAGLDRHDRVIGWTGDSLAVFNAAGGDPIAMFKDVNEAPRGAGWIGPDLVIWSDARIWRLNPDRKAVAWTMPIASMPTLPATPGTEDVDEAEATDLEGNDGFVNVGPQPPIVNARIRRARAGGLGIPMPGVPQGPRTSPDDPEQLVDLRPTPTRIVMLTSRGRLAALDPTDGKLAWQVRMAERGVDRLVATDEFTVARATSDRASSLLVVDTFSGTVLARPRFQSELGVTLANFTVSADGTLVYTLADGLATKDLFDSWEGSPPNERIADGGPGAAQFFGALRPDQLVVNQGLAAALSSGGMVRVYSLLTQREHQQQMSVGGNDWDASLHLVGSQLYTIAPRAFGSFDLVNPGPPETQLRTVPSDGDRPPTFRDALFGQRHVILLDTMGQGAPGEAPVSVPTYRLWAFSRERVNGVESGIIDHVEPVNEKVGITGWQTLDGGLVYHTADGKLHWLRGARK